MFDLADKTLFVTGSAGFIGSGFVRLMHRRFPTLRIFSFDKLTYAGNLANLAELADSPRHGFFRGDVAEMDQVLEGLASAESLFGSTVDAVVHFAAESHVDRSIEDPGAFLHTNIIGTETLLRAARGRGISRFLHVSTDEVYGTLAADDPAFTEHTPIAPNSPYAASKAGSDLIARSYWETYHYPVIITRCSNNYGPYQFPEKLIPLVIANAMEDRPIPVYGQGTNVRDWIHVDDHSRGIEAALTRGLPGQAYNLGGESEQRNIDVVREILGILGKPESLITYVTDRPGHDLRYAMNTSKARAELGWAPERHFGEALAETVLWYKANQEWVQAVRSGSYMDYYERMYGARGAHV
jgi:dTDP-glucose 4,6-dehydratase